MAQPSTTTNLFPGATRITTDRYHAMVARGIIEEGAPVELLDGFLVLKDRSKAGEDPMSIGARHAAAVGELTELAGEVRKRGARLRIQQPVTLPPDDEPEPDAAIVADAPHRYREAHPVAGDILCVVEVADSSLEHDRTTKQKIYAAAGIKQYVLLNLVQGRVEVFSDPDVGSGSYGTPAVLSGRDILRLSCGEATLDVEVAQLLGPVGG